nr:MAG TPA: hypothetical protein [Caudoviricetes sp.]
MRCASCDVSPASSIAFRQLLIAATTFLFFSRKILLIAIKRLHIMI